MAYKIFGTIDVGSYELNLKIYEISAERGVHVINHVRHRMELGSDTYETGNIGVRMEDELCGTLLDFKKILREFGADEYRACATSAIREAHNTPVLLDRIYVETGIRLEILSNAEQRFLGYKSIASNEERFRDYIAEGAAIVDVGGGSIQISLFDEGNLVTTQNIRMGTLRLKERLTEVEERTVRYASVIEELLDNELKTYRKLYLKDRDVNNILMMGSYLGNINQFIHEKQPGENKFTKKEFLRLYDYFMETGHQAIAQRLGIPAENGTLLTPAMVIYKRLLEETGAQNVIILHNDLGDGLAYDYAERKKIIIPHHNFENDIIESARRIAKRYRTDHAHTHTMEKMALTIFDKMKKAHGLKKRERLLLQIAVILHDCGSYINMSQSSECSYNIIMASEIIGISDREREMIANIVRFNSGDILSFEEVAAGSLLVQAEYVKIAKLTAILCVANALDRSHQQKIKDIRITFRDEHTMNIHVNSLEDLTLEQSLFREKTEFFEKVYSIRPVLKIKKAV
ncbi:MAG: HD domain-containing protein [Lachnospiraceae bacterium]|nr:HD domain-containing protein [Lachnospiraceae bacterium]